MSLHVDLTDCDGRDTDKGREVFWVARCECGWEGEARSSSSTGAAANLAHRDYRVHVEEALGAGAYYQAPAACRNCGVEREQWVLVGTHVTSATCERCGTRMLRPSNDAWDESRAVSRRWGL